MTTNDPTVWAPMQSTRCGARFYGSEAPLYCRLQAGHDGQHESDWYESESPAGKMSARARWNDR